MSSKKIVPNLSVQRPSRIAEEPAESKAKEPLLEEIESGTEEEHDDGRSDPRDPDETKEPEKRRAGRPKSAGRPKKDVKYMRVSWRLREDVLVELNLYLATRHGITREEVVNKALEDWLGAKKKQSEKKG